jgi:hypothetical protein
MKLRTKECFFQTPLKPQKTTTIQLPQAGDKAKQETRTIATDPQQRTILLPVTKCTTLDKPVCGPVVMGVTCSIVIDGRIWRGKPCSKLLSGLVPCEHVSAITINDGKHQGVTNVVVRRLLLIYKRERLIRV